MSRTTFLVCLALLVAVPAGLCDTPEEDLTHEESHEEEDLKHHDVLDIVDTPSSEEHLPEEHKRPRLNLEDPASWSASGEVLDENHAWYRRRRSSPGMRVVREVQEDQDLEAAESVVFMPAHLRLRKKVAEEECRDMHHQFNTRRRLHPGRTVPHSTRCNYHCCYPVMHLE